MQPIHLLAASCRIVCYQIEVAQRELCRLERLSGADGIPPTMAAGALKVLEDMESLRQRLFAMALEADNDNPKKAP